MFITEIYNKRGKNITKISKLSHLCFLPSEYFNSSCFLVSLQFTFKLILFQQQFSFPLFLWYCHDDTAPIFCQSCISNFTKLFFIVIFKNIPEKKWMIFFFKRIIFFPMNYWFCFRSLAVLRILFRFVFRFLPPGNWERGLQDRQAISA